MVDANYTDSDTTKYMGRVVYDTDTYDQSLEEAQENGDVTIDSYEPEKEVMTEAEKDANAGVVRDKDGNTQILNPELRIYNQPNIVTSEADIKTNLFTDKFMTMNLVQNQDYFNIRYQIKPFMIWIWISVL